ncbi:MAG: PQQ-binding-like beta-propeller repeat protein [Actinobacteria bacterium]|nr:PQQ-binding-like beta-propeller repeat protein [Actinomycetota bacterium]
MAEGVDVNGTATDLIYVGSEHGTFFAIKPDGTALWSRDLGSQTLNCDDTPDHIYGVEASAVFDHGGNRVFVVGGDGQLYALDPATGATLPGWPVRFTSLPDESVFSAPTMFGNHIYVEVASHCDQTPYKGRIIDIDPTNHVVAHTWYSLGNPDFDGGGVWGWGGASVDPSTGDVFAATANAAGVTPEGTPWGESIVRLSSSLVFEAGDSPGPTIRDDDFGSTPVLFQKQGCPAQLVVEQKNGSLYLYDRDTLSNGPQQRLVVSSPELIGVAAYSPATQMVYVATESDSPDESLKAGITAFSLDDGCNLHVAWNTPTPAGLNLMVANGVVYFTGGFGGVVYAVDAGTGAPLWNSGTTITGPVLAQPVMVKGRLYAVGYDHRLHAWGL